ncbi:jg11561 [Pararge aegeria aegeria]|uniref:Jg11561 protein n=1 Tax=Pararge aegeria aegeria TaxID=348720 RepID=A0A8S4SP82_9NEOP|nr:jg11561 [Pararge aegeria aegeria]
MKKKNKKKSLLHIQLESQADGAKQATPPPSSQEVTAACVIRGSHAGRTGNKNEKKTEPGFIFTLRKICQEQRAAFVYRPVASLFTYVPVITPALTPFRPEHSIATTQLSSSNKHAGSIVVLARTSSVTKSSSTYSTSLAGWTRRGGLCLAAARKALLWEAARTPPCPRPPSQGQSLNLLISYSWTSRPIFSKKRFRAQIHHAALLRVCGLRGSFRNDNNQDSLTRSLRQDSYRDRRGRESIPVSHYVAPARAVEGHRTDTASL